MNNWRVQTVQVLDSCNTFSEELGSLLLTESAFFFQKTVDLTLGTELEDEIKVVVILIMIVEPQDVVVVKNVHDLDF